MVGDNQKLDGQLWVRFKHDYSYLVIVGVCWKMVSHRQRKGIGEICMSTHMLLERQGYLLDRLATFR
jgi:hypothetical protein